MKVYNIKILKLMKLLCIGIWLCQVKSEVIINEFFTSPANNASIPQYIELYNNSNSPIDVTGWSIETTVNQSALGGSQNIIEPYGYYLISSLFIDCAPECGNYESDIWVGLILLPEDRIIIKNTLSAFETDTVEYDNTWPIEVGHSTN